MRGRHGVATFTRSNWNKRWSSEALIKSHSTSLITQNTSCQWNTHAFVRTHPLDFSIFLTYPYLRASSHTQCKLSPQYAWHCPVTRKVDSSNTLRLYFLQESTYKEEINSKVGGFKFFHKYEQRLNNSISLSRFTTCFYEELEIKCDPDVWLCGLPVKHKAMPRWATPIN